MERRKIRTTKLTFNLADREKHMDAFKKLYGEGNASKKDNRQDACPEPDKRNDHP
jgi:hypothetical protein